MSGIRRFDVPKSQLRLTGERTISARCRWFRVSGFAFVMKLTCPAAMSEQVGRIRKPSAYDRTQEIHSVVVLLGLSFFGYIWGFTGAPT